MAYVDGEVDEPAREAVESAMREDPQIAARVAQHRSLRLRVQAAYSAELSERVPERLLTAAGGARSKSRVVDLQAARVAPEHNASRGRPARRRRWRAAGAIAASVIVGVGLGFLMWGRSGPLLVRSNGGALVARGQLAEALSTQLAAEQSHGSAVLIGLTFLAKSGEYCRTFALSGTVSPSGLACRHDRQWRVEALAQTAGDTVGNSVYRTAGTSLPAAILTAVEGEIAGEPLDQAAEKSARQHGWNPAARPP
jgi:anti-sigma factor RsiW